MMLKFYSVFDSKMAAFSRPYLMMNDEVAIRALTDELARTDDPNSNLSRHPEDFSLYVLGEFDDATGEILPMKPLSLVTASALLVKDLGARKQPELWNGKEAFGNKPAAGK